MMGPRTSKELHLEGSPLATPVRSRFVPDLVLTIAFLAYVSLCWCKQLCLTPEKGYWLKPDNGIMLVLFVSMATCIAFGRTQAVGQIPSSQQNKFSIGYAAILNAASLCFVITLTWPLFQGAEASPVTLLIIQGGIATLCLVNLVRIRTGRFIQRDCTVVPHKKKLPQEIDAYLRLFRLQTDPNIKNKERLDAAFDLFHRLVQEDPACLDQEFLTAVDHEVEQAYGAFLDCRRTVFQDAVNNLANLIFKYETMREMEDAEQCD